MEASFTEQMHHEVKGLFPEGALQILVPPHPGPAPEARMDPSVRVIHTPTGAMVTCGDFGSQIENMVAAVLRLRVACDANQAA